MATNVELYEALKPTVGEEAAKMIAEVVPPTRDLATREDVGFVRSELGVVRSELSREIDLVRSELSREIDSVRHELALGFANVEVGFAKVDARFSAVDSRMHAENTRTIKWVVGVFITVWAATWGIFVSALKF